MFFINYWSPGTKAGFTGLKTSPHFGLYQSKNTRGLIDNVLTADALMEGLVLSQICGIYTF